MAKTQFKSSGTVVTSKFMQSIYAENGGHKHDGADLDGHCDKITVDELAQNVLDHIRMVVSDRFIGDIRAYAGSVIPEGYLLCDGSSVTNAQYQDYRDWVDANRPDLVSNGVYYTPDLQGKALVGANPKDTEHSFALGDTGGEYEHTLTAYEIPYHEHSQKSTSREGTTAGLANQGDSGDNNKSNGWTDDGFRFVNAQGGFTEWDAAVAKSNMGQPHNNIQPYATVNYIIRAM